jgi:hypothetical protein
VGVSGIKGGARVGGWRGGMGVLSLVREDWQY